MTTLRLPRPMPPEPLRDMAWDAASADFAPAPELYAWAWATFIAEDAPLHNPDHLHLEHSQIGMLWTNCKNEKQLRVIAGTAEIPAPRGGAWQNAKMFEQLRRWFGFIPDAVITVSGPHAALVLDDSSFCALIEHELYHLAHKESPTSGPMFNQEGRPVLTIRGHDVEEFVGVVRRYGARAAGVEEMVAAARAAETSPILTGDAIGLACGTCLAKVA